MPASREQVVEAARRWEGTRWRHQGRSATGIDCAGLILQVGVELGLLAKDCDVQGYARQSQGPEFLGHLRRHLSISRVANWRPGSVLVFRVPRFPYHVAIGSEKRGYPHIIHASLRHRKVVEEPFINDWPDSITHCFEYPGL